MSPQMRYVVRVVAIGIVAAASALKAYLPGLSWADGIDVLISTIVAMGAYAGIGAATPLEPSVGKGAPPKG